MMKWRCNIGSFGRTKRKIKKDGIRRETNHKRLNLTKQTEGCWGEVCWERMVGVWTLERAGAMVSDGECCEMCNLVIHRPVPLGIKTHYIKNF